MPNNTNNLEKIFEILSQKKISPDRLKELSLNLLNRSFQIQQANLYNPQINWNEIGITFNDLKELAKAENNNMPILINNLTGNLLITKIILGFTNNENFLNGLESIEKRLLFYMDCTSQEKFLLEIFNILLAKEINNKKVK